jgi:ribosome-binding factor A
MPSPRRLEKISNLLKEEIAAILDREIDVPEEILLTVTRVIVSSDSHYGDVFVSILGGGPASMREILGKNIYHIQQKLNRRVRMRPVPKIRFFLDESEMRREGIEKALSALKDETGYQAEEAL